MKQTQLIKEIPLAHTKEGVIKISHIQHPYGEDSPAVVSIGVSLNGEDIDWKAHIPYENVNDVILALNHAKNLFDKEN
ncbi:MAG: hypothetical protein GXO40_04875 [Epsilonproteobacteria bacterium]|nr:hypothetical protein [Campylobacterota bacterium]